MTDTQTTRQHVLSVVETMREEILSLLSELVRIPSVNPRYPGVDYDSTVGGESDCNRYLAREYAKFGCTVDFVEVESGRANLVGVLKGLGGGRSIIYNGHVDVVPVGKSLDWKFGDPFSGKREDGRIYGRGSCDMKAGLVAQAKGVEAVLRSGIGLKGDVILESVIGEETMSHEVGVSAVCSQYKADGAIVSEPTAPPRSLAVSPVTAGLLWFTLTCSGKSSHASVRYEMIRAGGQGETIAVSAIEKGMYLIEALRRLEDQWGQSKSHPLFRPGHFTIHPGVVTGGPFGVLIPFLISQFCTIEYAVWYPPHESAEDIKSEIRGYIDAACQLDPWLRANPPEIKFNLHWPPSELDITHPIVQTCVNAHREANEPGAEERDLLHGFGAVCDAAFLNRAGIPTVIYGPGSVLQAHAVDEYVEEDLVVEAAKTYALAAMDWCGYE